uniref:MAGE domain-containing protein n=1 Tax=Marmota marmota marmota TaxID=9994 RepID=A0A8C5ZZ24_MARMA
DGRGREGRGRRLLSPSTLNSLIASESPSTPEAPGISKEPSSSEILSYSEASNISQKQRISKAWGMLKTQKNSRSPSTIKREKSFKKGLLTVMLGIIFMVGTCATESLIWEVLQKLGVQLKKKYRIFGNLKKVITQEFVQRGYLEYKPVNNGSPLEYAFFWGPKANRENSKMEILQFVAKVYNRDPRDWPSQYSEAVKQEEARMGERNYTGTEAAGTLEE